MQAIVHFRKDIYGPIELSLNVAGRGSDHIWKICSVYAQTRGFDWPYWDTFYHQTDRKLDRLMLKRGTPIIKTAN
jgi:hypothetical protein